MSNRTIFGIIITLLVIIAGVAAYAVFLNPSMPADIAREAGSLPGKVGEIAGRPNGDAPQPGAAPAESNATFTMADIAAHASAENCYTAIDGVVYDLTPFISRHPGGVPAISSLCGIDGTAGFTAMHGGKSKPENQLARLRIGVLAQ